MYSTTALLVARARQDEFLRDAERRPRGEAEAKPDGNVGRRDQAPRWFRFPRLAGSRA